MTTLVNGQPPIVIYPSISGGTGPPGPPGEDGAPGAPGGVTTVNGAGGVVVVDDAAVAAATDEKPVLWAVAGTHALTGLAAAVADANLNGHGEVRIPRGGVYTLADSLTLNRGVRLIAEGSQVTYTGSGLGVLLTDTGVDTPLGPQVIGGEWKATGLATGIMRIQDLGGCLIRDVKFYDCTGGPAVEVRNFIRWCENNWINDCRFTNNKHAVIFTPANSGGGTASFARTKIVNPVVGGGVSGEPAFWFAGGVYGSTLGPFVGNLADGAIMCRFDNAFAGGAGTIGLSMGGSVVLGIDVENTTGGPEVSYAFEKLGGTGGVMPVFIGNRHLSANITEWNGTVNRFGAEPKLGVIRFDDAATNPGTPPAGTTNIFSQSGKIVKQSNTGGILPLSTEEFANAVVTFHNATAGAHGLPAVADLVRQDANSIGPAPVITQATYNGLTPIAGRVYFISG